MTSKESANRENSILKLKYSNPVPSFEINNIQFFKTKHKNIHVSKNGYIFNERKDRITKGKYDKDGYLRVSVNTPYKGSKGVHAIMMETFYGDCPKDYVVDHINSIRDDNRLENLRYVTNSYNVQRGTAGKPSPFAQKTIVEFEDKIYKFNSIEDFLKAFNVDARILHRFKHGVKRTKRQRFVIHSFEVSNDINLIKLIKFSYRLHLNGSEYKFDDISSMLKFLGISHNTYYSRYIAKKKNCCGYKVIDFKEGQETIEITMETL